jgi:hypothetical protein
MTRQLMRSERTLEADWRQVLRGSVGMGIKEDESSTGRFWAAGFHHVTARPRLAGFLIIMNSLFDFQTFFSGRDKPRVLNQWIRGHDCNDISSTICKV